MGGCAVDLAVAAAATGVVDEIVAEGADAGLLGIRVDLVVSAFYEDA